jgi:hypothetical protein
MPRLMALEVAELMNRGIEGETSIQHHGLGQVHSGDNAASPLVAYIEGVGVAVAHRRPNGRDRTFAVNEYGQLAALAAGMAGNDLCEETARTGSVFPDDAGLC